MEVRVRVRACAFVKIVEIAAVAPLVPGPWHPKLTLTLLPADTPPASSVHPSSTAPPRTTSRLLVPSSACPVLGPFPPLSQPSRLLAGTKASLLRRPFLLLTRRSGPF